MNFAGDRQLDSPYGLDLWSASSPVALELPDSLVDKLEELEDEDEDDDDKSTSSDAIEDSLRKIDAVWTGY